jgi:uncharacterized protein YkwD
MPEDRNAWSAPNSDNVCYACGKPYNRPPGIGCYLKNLHSSGINSAQPEQALAEQVARQAEAARESRRRDGKNLGRSPPAPSTPELDAEIKKRNRIAFLQGKIPQLQRRLSYLERGGGSKWEIEHVKNAISDLTTELASLEGGSSAGKASDQRQPQSEAAPNSPAPPTLGTQEEEWYEIPGGARVTKSALDILEVGTLAQIEQGMMNNPTEAQVKLCDSLVDKGDLTKDPIHGTFRLTGKGLERVKDGYERGILVQQAKPAPNMAVGASQGPPAPFGNRSQGSRRPRLPRWRFRNLRFGRTRWFRWKFVYLLLFLAIFSLYLWRDTMGTPSPLDFKLWGYSLVLWNVSVPFPLLLYSLVSAFLIFVPIRILGWGAKQVARHRFAKGIATLVVVFLLVGFAVSNSPLQSKLAPSPGQFYSSLSDLGSYATALGNQANSATQPSPSGSGVSQSGSGAVTSTTSSLTTATSVVSSGFTISDPAFYNGKANIAYPPDYSTLANYALGLINQDREANGESSVTLSTVPSGQQHADSMVYYGYFSHWDTQGYKPYMRYTLLGGTGAVAENIGQSTCTDSPPDSSLLTVQPCTVSTIESGIAASEWGMMNNDLQCCNNGHRDNILDPQHNRVSIGIAYDASSSTLYFVEDFEDQYLSLSSPVSGSGDLITIQGTLSTSLSVSQLAVYYDPTPSPMTVSQLDATFAYDPGTFVGGVFPPCSSGCEYYPGAVSVYASEWSTTSTSVNIQFSLSQFTSADGPGVYTVYLQTSDSSGSAFFVYSVFV